MESGATKLAPRQGSERLQAHDRVRKRYEYRRIQANAQRVHSPRFVWLVAPRPAAQSDVPDDAVRLGITVTKKVASAVGRNHIKRVLRETFRRHRQWLPQGVDLVVIAKREARGVDYAGCCKELSSAAPALARAARRATSAQRAGPKGSAS